MTTPTYLSQKNSHPRDKYITFDEEPHIYTIKGDDSYMSVTTWNHSHFAPFNGKEIIKKLNRNEGSKYYNMTDEQILQQWEDNRNQAAQAGTKLHFDIECFYNNLPVSNTSIEYSYFITFSKTINFTPYRTEWMIYAEDLKLAGSIDMVYEDNLGNILIYDWKRCKDISKGSRFNKYSTTNCISHLPDTNFWHYTLQLNTYAYILKHYYKKIVTHLCLVCLHPNNKDYQIIKVPILNEEINDLMQYRKFLLSQ
jgi:hypothetical protein